MGEEFIHVPATNVTMVVTALLVGELLLSVWITILCTMNLKLAKKRWKKIKKLGKIEIERKVSRVRRS